MRDDTQFKKPLDLSALREKLAAKHGQEYWRSLEQLADSEDFRQYLHHEFPHQLPAGFSDVDRRGFLRLMSASLALAGLSACTRQPTERIVPYVQPPEQFVPGKPLFFATAMPLGGSATGLLVESHMGRPTKVEGNPEHPSSLGGTDIFAQASILTLYDPDRSQSVLHLGRPSSWSSFVTALSEKLEAQRLKKGSGLRVLSEPAISPFEAELFRQLLAMFPSARWHQYDPVSRDGALEASRMAFGEALDSRYDFAQADVVVSLDADFLGGGPGSLRYTREFSRRRRVSDGLKEMNRLYVAESTPTITGAKADHRLPVPPSRLPLFARALAAGLGVPGLPPGSAELSSEESRWIQALCTDLKKHSGKSLVLAGDFQPAAVHLLAQAMNHALGNTGRTVVYGEPAVRQPVDSRGSLRELVAEMNSGSVDLLVIVGANPVYSAPADLDFSLALGKVRERMHLGLYEDETGHLCQWHVPEAHYLERWGDACAHDGTVSIIQPLVEPLYAGKSAADLLAAMIGKTDQTAYELLRGYWKSRNLVPESEFERFWEKSLHGGFIPGTASPAKPAALRPEWSARLEIARPEPGLELLFRPDPTLGDGRFANNGWLQELPKPLTKLTWDNAALISPATAEKLGIAAEDLLELRLGERSVQAPAWIAPGQPDGTVTIHLGYGRTHAGRVGNRTGFHAGLLRTTGAWWSASGLQVSKAGGSYPLSCTQHHHGMEGRDLVRTAWLSKYLEDPESLHPGAHGSDENLSLYAEHPYPGYAWGLSVDLNACTGCNACIVACQSENNIPVVGKEQVANGREMHWIRLDRYHSGGPDNPETHYQPVMCMHCENAPCEPVCPVAATVHSSEGLNDMVYNRCVGTRYCSNNCPYKVRRFNFLLFSDFETGSLKMMRNPDVSVRSRGVMEKCTFCVQRISAAKIQAEKEDRPVRDGEIVTACQAVCPAEAMVFGDTNDPESRVSKLKKSPLSYGLLTELNTRPRTTYLAKLKNPNPELA